MVKGLFSFYLEDLVRPYQQVFFPKRIDGIFFNERNPHLKPGSTAMLLGRKEQLNNKQFNPDHFLTKCHTKAHRLFGKTSSPDYESNKKFGCSTSW